MSRRTKILSGRSSLSFEAPDGLLDIDHIMHMDPWKDMDKFDKSEIGRIQSVLNDFNSKVLEQKSTKERRTIGVATKPKSKVEERTNEKSKGSKSSYSKERSRSTGEQSEAQRKQKEKEKPVVARKPGPKKMTDKSKPGKPSENTKPSAETKKPVKGADAKRSISNSVAKRANGTVDRVNAKVATRIPKINKDANAPKENNAQAPKKGVEPKKRTAKKASVNTKVSATSEKETKCGYNAQSRNRKALEWVKNSSQLTSGSQNLQRHRASEAAEHTNSNTAFNDKQHYLDSVTNENIAKDAEEYGRDTGLNRTFNKDLNFDSNTPQASVKEEPMETESADSAWNSSMSSYQTASCDTIPEKHNSPIERHNEERNGKAVRFPAKLERPSHPPNSREKPIECRRKWHEKKASKAIKKFGYHIFHIANLNVHDDSESSDSGSSCSDCSEESSYSTSSYSTCSRSSCSCCSSYESDEYSEYTICSSSGCESSFHTTSRDSDSDSNCTCVSAES